MIRAFFISTVLAAAMVAGPPPAEDKDENGAIPYPENAVPEDNEALKEALKTEPVSIRAREIEANCKITRFFAGRPGLAYRLIQEYSQMELSFDEEPDEDGDWSVTGLGKTYYFKPLSVNEKTFMLAFSYLYKFPMGIGVKSSGEGALVIRMKEKKGENENDPPKTEADYDVYLITSSLPLDRATKNAPFIQQGLIRADFDAILASFTQMLEHVAEEPEAVAEEMEEEDEIFSAEELAEFRKTALAPEK